ncbi:serine hydrolase domain-containing protein [Streptomyces sp. A0592]|uniref:serine hydrolase domain-containing protein n=1 Tax=Streptomyces sp. A0592 TaxID=2563099 RepID=UPI00109E3D80|nr:serine hydrolase domain-containing protein [Streptomyces sp. A0592]THA86218.1 class A beta-lactamase-related serine hydrolase [Streptomyces sp. A0592]
MSHTRPAARPARRQLRRAASATAVAVALLAGLAPAAGAATAEPDAAQAASAGRRLDRAALQARLDAVRDAGVYGIFSAARNGRERFDGAAGVADLSTGRPVRADLRHRVGSVTKTFTAVAVLQQNAKGRIDLDRPVGDYVPELLPGERGRKVTVRMLLNHTSGIEDYIADAFPSLQQGTTASLDDHRFRTIRPTELIGYGVARPQRFEPGTEWSYSNTNYLLLGEILRKVTGQDPEKLIAKDVIRRAGLRDTYFPGTDPYIRGAHARMYESFYGLIDPPRDYSVYNMTWGGTAGALVSTPQDLNTFYRALLTGDLLPRRQLDQMRTTIDIKDETGKVTLRYGLGIYSMDTPCGPAWGHDGGVWGAGTQALSSPDGTRQFALGYNLMKYQRINEAGTGLDPHPADAAMTDYRDQALCGRTAPKPPQAPKVPKNESVEAPAPLVPALPVLPAR